MILQLPIILPKKKWLLANSSSEKQGTKNSFKTYVNILNWKYTWCVELTDEHMPAALAAFVEVGWNQYKLN